MANNRKTGKGNRGGSSNRRDEDERAQRSEGRGDRPRQGEQREESGRGSSKSVEGGRGEGKKKGTER